MVLDTNVVSEIMRQKPDAAVLAWLDQRAPSDLWLTSINAAELMVGVALLPNGARRQRFANAVSLTLSEDFADQILPFDLAAASCYAAIVAERKSAGQTIAMADAQIAAICLVHEAMLVTRNERHFAGLGLTVINPWRAIN